MRYRRPETLALSIAAARDIIFSDTGTHGDGRWSSATPQPLQTSTFPRFLSIMNKDNRAMSIHVDDTKEYPIPQCCCFTSRNCTRTHYAARKNRSTRTSLHSIGTMSNYQPSCFRNQGTADRCYHRHSRKLDKRQRTQQLNMRGWCYTTYRRFGCIATLHPCSVS